MSLCCMIKSFEIRHIGQSLENVNSWTAPDKIEGNHQLR